MASPTTENNYKGSTRSKKALNNEGNSVIFCAPLVRPPFRLSPPLINTHCNIMKCNSNALVTYKKLLPGPQLQLSVLPISLHPHCIDSLPFPKYWLQSCCLKYLNRQWTQYWIWGAKMALVICALPDISEMAIKLIWKFELWQILVLLIGRIWYDLLSWSAHAVGKRFKECPGAV